MNKQIRAIYNQFRNHLLESRRLSFIQFDKAILTLSGGGLALSLTFVDNVIPTFGSDYIGSLVAAWILFALSVTATLISFRSSQSDFDRKLELLDKFDGEDNDKVLDEPNRPAKITMLLNDVSALAFVSAVLLLIFFVSINVYF